MSKILFNPDEGAPISNVTYEGTIYFAEKIFEPGSIFKFESEETAAFFQKIFGFLEGVSVERAKELMNKPSLKCEKCEFTTRNKGILLNHQKKHVAEAELDELGIPVVRQTSQQKIASEMVNTDVQKQIDGEGRTFNDGYPGLEGEGLVKESANPGAIMSGN